MLSLLVATAPAAAFANGDDAEGAAQSAGAEPGPCAHAPLSALTERPTPDYVSSATETICVPRPGQLVVTAGYRNYATEPSAQHLVTVPQPTLQIGLPDAVEVVVLPGIAYTQRTAATASPAAAGFQDAGVSVQHLVSDGRVVQQGVAAFVTVPTGHPQGATGFSTGLPSYSISYTVGISLARRVAFALETSGTVASAATPSHELGRFAGLVETGKITYGVTPSTNVLFQDTALAPMGPHDVAGNLAFATIQQTLSPAVVLDLDYGFDALPPPGTNQHTTFEAGISVLR